MPKKESITINSSGGPVFTGKVDNRGGKISGRSDRYANGFNSDEVSKLFDNLFAVIDQHDGLSKDDKADIKEEIQEVRQELGKKDNADESFIIRRLRNIARIAPDIFEVTLATIANPVAGFGIIASKISEKAKSTS